MASLPPIAIGTPMARQLQARIQGALAAKGWADEGDDVMAEYVLVMLANNKTAPQINAELSDLIGNEYSDDFTQWLWAERAKLADGGAEEQAQPVQEEESRAESHAPSRPPDDRRSRSPVQDRQRRRSYGRRSASPVGPAGPREGVAERWRRSPQQEQRGAWGQQATPHDNRWGRMDSSREQRNGWGAARGQRRELFGEPAQRPDDRMAGPSQPRHVGMASDDPALNDERRTVSADAPPTAPRVMRVKGVAQSSLFQRSLGQAQSQSGPQAQASAPQAGNVARGGAAPSIFSRMSVPDPRAAAFQPLGVQSAPAQPQQAATAPATGFASISSLLSRIDPMVPDNPLPSSSPPAGGEAVPSIDASTFPTKPIHSSLCRYGTRCSDPTCAYSHPSVAAVAKARQTGEEPLILNSQACNFQENCTRPDCERGHISPSVAFLKAKLEREGSAMAVGPGFDGNGSTTAACKFQDKCTNPSCTFAHFDGAGKVGPSPALSRMATRSGDGSEETGDGYSLLPQSDAMDAEDDVDFTMDTPDVGTGGDEAKDAASLRARLDARLDRPLGSGNGFGGAAPSSIPCRFGSSCLREDCHFQHPFGRKSGGAMGGKGEDKKALGPCRYGLGCNRADCHFSHPSGHTLASSTDSTMSKNAPHISDRLARFGGGGKEKGSTDEEMERIIPGSGLGSGIGSGVDGSTDERSEVHFRREAKREDEDDVVDLGS